MAKLTRSNSLSALAEGQVVFSAGTGRFTIGITGHDGVQRESCKPSVTSSLKSWKAHAGHAAAQRPQGGRAPQE